MDYKWIYNLKTNVLNFLKLMESKDNPGFYRFSVKGDLYSEKYHWNLAGSVFALKILHMLQHKEVKKINAASDYIKTFIQEDNLIYDNFLHRKARYKRYFISLKSFKSINYFAQKCKIAETRQSLSALMSFSTLPDNFEVNFPQKKMEINNILKKLDWSNPWSSGSHLSHLLFFLKAGYELNQLSEANYNHLINYTIQYVDRLQNASDGAWYKGNPSMKIKINGAMKILTGFKVVNHTDIKYPKKLVDLCLEGINDETACDNFNILFVLNYASKVLGRLYRTEEVKQFVINRLRLYKKHYHPEFGAFSFYIKKSNTHYYGTKISQGLNEPDIHGTVMFLWGISIAAQILGLSKEIELTEQIA